MAEEYPEGLSVEEALEMLLYSVEKLKFYMGGTEATKNCTDLINEWDKSIPTIHYLERNMRWAEYVLNKERNKE